MNRRAAMLLCMLPFSITACGEEEKMVADIDVSLTDSGKVKRVGLTIESCRQVLQNNLHQLPYNFIDIGEGIFESNSENWKAYVQCDHEQITVTVQSKKTIDPAYERLTPESLQRKLNSIIQVTKSLQPNNP